MSRKRPFATTRCALALLSTVTGCTILDIYPPDMGMDAETGVGTCGDRCLNDSGNSRDVPSESETDRDARASDSNVDSADTATRDASLDASGNADSSGNVDASEMDADGGSCQPPTPDRCNGMCVDTRSHPRYCGDRITSCSYPHAVAQCTQGICAMGDCAQGYGDCKNGPADGCETYLLGDDVNRCGACNTKCKVGQLCASGTCQDNFVSCTTPGITCRQGGCFDPNRYAVSAGGDIVVDTKAASPRRLWSRATHGPLGHLAAVSECTTLLLEGINGWRLPKYAELAEIQLNTGGLNGCPTCSPAIDQSAFPDTPNVAPYYLSDDLRAGQGYLMYYYCDGRNNYPSNDPALFRCTHDPLP